MHGDDELEHGSAAWQLVPELSVADAEPVVDKTYGDAFEATELDAILAALDVGSLVVAGDSLQAAGLLFAGSDQTTVINPIQAVIDCLNVDL